MSDTTPIPPSPDKQSSSSMMPRIMAALGEQLFKQGPMVLLLTAALYIVYNRMERLEEEIKICNQTMIEVHSSDRQHMQEALINSTEALKNNNQALHEIKAILRR